MKKPDWSQAPSWASYLGEQPNGKWWWFEREPRRDKVGYLRTRLGLSGPHEEWDWPEIEKRPEPPND